MFFSIAVVHCGQSLVFADNQAAVSDCSADATCHLRTSVQDAGAAATNTQFTNFPRTAATIEVQHTTVSLI